MAVRPVDVSIITSGHDAADARLHREVASLRRLGLSVEVLALGSPGDAPRGADRRIWERRGPGRRALLALALPWMARGRVLVALDPDSAAGAYLRRCLTGLPGLRRLRLVADTHEDYRSLLADRPWAAGWKGRPGLAAARLGEWAAARADLAVVADQHLLPAARRRLVVRNLPDLSMLPPGGAGEPDAVPRALYVGDLRATRGLFTMLEAARGAPAWTLELIGPLAREDGAELARRLAQDPDLAGRVRLRGRVPPERAWASARGAWAGLALLDQTPAFGRSMPSKVYEYLACGLPVITTPLPRPAALIRQTGAGAVVEDAVGAARVLRAWQSDPAAYRQVRQAAAAARAQALAQPDEMAAFARRVQSLAGQTG